VIRFLSAFVACVLLSPTAVGDDLHNATLWMQRSAERDALCRQAFALAGTNLARALFDPSWQAVASPSTASADLSPAVIIDVDETLLDNHWYEARLVRDGRHYERESWSAWCREEAATAIPGALQFCTYADSLGVTIYYVTNRRVDVAVATLANLKALGFPVAEDGSTLLPRTESSDKTERRAAVAAQHRVVLLVGDSGGDFDASLAGEVELSRSAVATRFADRWGASWIVLPNPMYGAWAKGELAFSSPGHVEPVASSSGSDAADSVSRHPLLRSGPMAAWTDMTAAAVWVQTTGPATVQLRFWPSGQAELARLTEPVRTDRSGDHIASFVLDELEPGARTDYELFLDGRRANLPWPLAVSTQPIWQWRGPGDGKPHDPPEFSFLLGSCNYVNDAPFDRPGRPYGAGHEIFESMADVSADFMLWLGDNTYFREADTSSEAAMRSRYAHTRALPELQRLLGSTHNVALWDDHDYGPDNSDRSFGMKGPVRRIFSDYWPDRPRGLPGVPGTFLRMSYGDVDFFLLDDRTFRAPNDAPPGPDKVMLGREQMSWLKDGLLDSRASFKLIVNGGQMLHPVPDHEDWARYPDERDELLSFLASQAIEGVVFLSGDRHQSELMRVQWPDAAPWFELTCSPLTAGPASSGHRSSHSARVEGSWIGERNFGIARLTGAWGDRTLSFSLHDVDGQELWSHAIHQDELKTTR
jgi:alkaline phosphatase D